MQFGPVVTADQKDLFERPCYVEEVKESLMSIDGVKTPGPDGFGAYFYKDAWEVVGEDIIQAIVGFFRSEKLLKEVNSTAITLIPKNKLNDPQILVI